jgi:hypothetical protein
LNQSTPLSRGRRSDRFWEAIRDVLDIIDLRMNRSLDSDDGTQIATFSRMRPPMTSRESDDVVEKLRRKIEILQFSIYSRIGKDPCRSLQHTRTRPISAPEAQTIKKHLLVRPTGHEIIFKDSSVVMRVTNSKRTDEKLVALSRNSPLCL